jgi:hypothetical protein
LYLMMSKMTAVLGITDHIPDGVIPLPLVPAAELWGHHYRTFGFPQDYDQGVWIKGDLLERNASGWVQMIDPKQPGHIIAPGFSGGPVWDDDLNGVVGMVVAADLEIANKTGYCIPATTLLQICQEFSIPVDQISHINTAFGHIICSYELVLQIQAVF